MFGSQHLPALREVERQFLSEFDYVREAANMEAIGSVLNQVWPGIHLVPWRCEDEYSHMFLDDAASSLAEIGLRATPISGALFSRGVGDGVFTRGQDDRRPPRSAGPGSLHNLPAPLSPMVKCAMRMIEIEPLLLILTGGDATGYYA